MKRILIIIAVFISSIVVFACHEDTLEPEKPDIPVYFSISPRSLTFGSDDTETQDIYIAALNAGWRAEVEASAQQWLKITEETGKITVRVEENTTEADRSGKITIIPDHETLQPMEAIVWQSFMETVRFSSTVGVVSFLGDRYKTGYGAYLITLGCGEVEYARGRVLMGTGFQALVELLADDIEHWEFRTVEPRPGRYVSLEMDQADSRFKYEKWSLLKTFRDEVNGATYFGGSMIVNYLDGRPSENVVLKRGTLTVEKKEEDNYTVVTGLVTEQGQRIIIDYSGPFDSKQNDVSFSTYTADRNLTGLNTGHIMYTTSEVEGCHKWIIKLANSQATIMMVAYSPMTNEYVLDDGDYTITDPPDGAFTIKAGDVLYNVALQYTYLKEFDNKRQIINQTPLIEGTVHVKHNYDNNYTFEVDAFMDNYYKLTASFEGDLEYYHWTGAGLAGVPFKLENGPEFPALPIIPQKTD